MSGWSQGLEMMEDAGRVSVRRGGTEEECGGSGVKERGAPAPITHILNLTPNLVDLT